MYCNQSVNQAINQSILQLLLQFKKKHNVTMQESHQVSTN